MPRMVYYINVRIHILYIITVPLSDVRFVVLPSNTGSFLVEIVGSVIQTSGSVFESYFLHAPIEDLVWQVPYFIHTRLY